MSSDFDEFKQYYALADKLYEMMTAEQILESLRMLALHLADYRTRFGVVERRDLYTLNREKGAARQKRQMHF